MPLRYHHPPGVTLRLDDPPLFLIDHGKPPPGVVVTDAALADLWRRADGRTLAELRVLPDLDASLDAVVPEAVACLVAAQLLRRDPSVAQPPPTASPFTNGPLVSVIVVVSSAREMEFLDDCLASVARSSYRALELVVVDNDSGAPVDSCATRHMREPILVRVPTRVRLARACNLAMGRARGDFALLMNPDVKIAPDTIGALVARATGDPSAAAVVPKTRLWRTPAFLNGTGNRARYTDWGTDNGIGQLDLGQFDGWREAPSASLTIQLVSRAAWTAVGTFDEGFPAYYEDADWSYRARLRGWRILAEPAAEAFHIFGGFWDAAEDGGLTASKLETAVIGRLRFTVKIAEFRPLCRCVRDYFRQDLGNLVLMLKRRRYRDALTYPRAWLKVLGQSVALARARAALQRCRRVDDRVLFPAESTMPREYTWKNAPLLTAAIVRAEYAPILRTQERPAPELPQRSQT